MIRPTRAVVFGAAFALLELGAQLTAGSHATAQWLPDRAYREGPGFRLGNFELHPGVAVRGGYDTNVFRTPGTAENPEQGSAVLAVSPHLNLSTVGRQRRTEGEDAAGAPGQLPPPIAFNLGTSATYFHYFLDRAPNNVELDLDTNLSVLPERRFGFDVGAQYARGTRAFTADVDGKNNTYAFDRINPSLLLRGQSRGGVLRGSVGFAPIITVYESKVFRYLSQNQYEVPARLSWSFLPNTALLYDGVFGLNDYAKDVNENTRATIFVSDSKRFQSRLGINGAITPRLAARLIVGYAAIVFDRPELHEHEDVVGEAALTFAWTQKDSAEIGYQRSVEVSNLGGWTQLDRGYLKSSMVFAGMFAVSLDAGVAHVNYGRLLKPNGDPLGLGEDETRDDIRIDGGVHAEYRATNWLAIMADFTALATLTDFKYELDSGGGVIPYPGRFKTFQVFGGVRAHY